MSDAPNVTQSPGRGGGTAMARGLRPDSALGLTLASVVNGGFVPQRRP
ncbi:hypothetical protein [Roseovarius sp. THAF8]|nr:hypothetical protein [Roseovarius sp. THAF8]